MAWSDLIQLSSNGKQYSSTNGELYGAGNKRVQVFSILITNTNAVNGVDVQTYFPTNAIADRRFATTIAATNTHEYYQKAPFCLSSNGKIYGKASSASTVNILITGRYEI